jgi:low temperature requirement protein LtrA
MFLKFKIITIRMGYEKGKEKEEERQHVSWLELFYDLVFAAAIAQLGRNLSYDLSIQGFVEYVILFVIICWAWTGATFYATRFNVDDLVHRILILLQMAGAISLAVNLHRAFEETSIGFIISYVVIRSLVILEYLRTGRKIKEARPLTSKYSICFACTTFLWLISIFVPTPFQSIVWILAIGADIIVTIMITKKYVNLSPNTFHLSERMGLFVIIVLGETTLGLVFSLSGLEWSVQTILGMGAGITIAFGLWWIYFDTIDGSAIRALKERRKVGIYLSWLYLHIPLLIGLAAMGDGISHAIKAHQNIPIPASELWLICGSVALGLFSMGLLHLVSFEANSSRKIGLKWLFYRFISAFIVIMIAVLGVKVLPITLLFTIAIVCVIQIIIDLRYHPYHRIFKT